MSKAITPREIELYRPLGLKDFVGCEEIKRTFIKRIVQNHTGSNTLIDGDTGTGKTSLVETWVRTLICPKTKDPSSGPCGTCGDCLDFSFEDVDAGIYASVRRKRIQDEILNFFNVNCASLANSINSLSDKVNDVRESAERGHVLVFLDEIQYLAKSDSFRVLLKPLNEIRNVTWIGCGVGLSQLNPMFRRRFACRYQMKRPTEAETVEFVKTRCREWNITTDDLTALILSRRSHQVLSECLSVLAKAAESPTRELTTELVKSHDFLGAVTPSVP